MGNCYSFQGNDKVELYKCRECLEGYVLYYYVEEHQNKYKKCSLCCGEIYIPKYEWLKNKQDKNNKNNKRIKILENTVMMLQNKVVELTIISKNSYIKNCNSNIKKKGKKKRNIHNNRQSQNNYTILTNKLTTICEDVENQNIN